MEPRKSSDRTMRTILISLVLKAFITAWSVYIAVQSESSRVSLFYLAVAIVFAGLFVFQLDYYRKKRTENR
jgi:hypothetical protein